MCRAVCDVLGVVTLLDSTIMCVFLSEGGRREPATASSSWPAVTRDITFGHVPIKAQLVT